MGGAEGSGGTGGSGGDPSAAAVAAWDALLARARSELAQGKFEDAERHAEQLLQGSAPGALRISALLVAADAAYEMRLYGLAARRYGRFVSEQSDGPDAPRAAMAVGWSRLRQGDHERARRAFTEFADARPDDDARAPLALALAAELASRADDTASSRQLLDRILTRYPASPYAATARLSRAALALRDQQESEALRDLAEVIRVEGPAVLDERRKLTEALVTTGTERALETRATRPARAVGGGHSLDRFAARLLNGHDGDATPYSLHGVLLLSAGDRGWLDPLTVGLATRLAETFPAYAPAPALLTRIAGAASDAGQWPTALRTWQTLLASAPEPRARLGVGEAQFRTGATSAARAELERVAATGGEEAARALVLLTELHTAAGDRRAALTAYDRLLREHPRTERSARSLLAHARLLEELGEGARARPVLERVVERAEGGEVAAEAAYQLGQRARADGQHAAAVEWYLTATYVSGASRWSRLALLGAGQSLTALNERREALAVYRRLVPARADIERADDRELRGEAAYRAAEILRDAELHVEALEMFRTSATLTAGRPAERRALVGALRCLIATGDRKSAEAIYRRLATSAGVEPELLAQARDALRNGHRVPPRNGAPDSALPRSAR
jgi:cellulose synthase operon protein C